MFGDRTESGPI